MIVQQLSVLSVWLIVSSYVGLAFSQLYAVDFSSLSAFKRSIKRVDLSDFLNFT